MRLLYHCAESEGGLAEYSRHQAAALATLPNTEILWHAPAGVDMPEGVSPLDALCVPKRHSGRNKLRRAVDFALDTLLPYSALSQEIAKTQPDAVLLSSWSEYFAPLWAPRLRRWQKRGVRCGAVIHDPVRDYVRGPLWWHRYSIRQAYSFLDVAFTHDAASPETCGSSVALRTVQLPHGPYPVPLGEAAKTELRREFGIPESADVLLSFGHIRDGKNLDQIIAALPSLLSVHLLVAGREQSAGQKPAAYYQDLASKLGVADRCHWYTNYIPNDEVWKYFLASDLLLLTYTQDFRSASGVLNVNTQFGLPVLASAGAGPLLEAVKRYGLGSILQHPDATSIAQAVPEALRVKGEWLRFAEENSWRINAERVVDALSEKADNRKS
jgi:glycosyltransferase involved in cell wall biosynthesis